MDGCIGIVLDQVLAQKDSILVVVALPGHEPDQRVFAKRQFTVAGGCAICNDVSLLYNIVLEDDRSLVIAVALVGTDKLSQMILVQLSVCPADDNPVCLRTFHHAIMLCNNADT